jgi:hypothetical protein
MAQDAGYLIGGARDLYGAVSGQTFTAMNPTPGTGILGHAAPTTFDATKPYGLLYNPVGSGVLVVPLFLRLSTTVAGVASVAMRFTQVLDPGTSTGGTRYSSAGTQLVPVNTNMQSRVGNQALAYAGAVVATGANAGSRTVANTVFKTILGTVGDVYQLSWGAPMLQDPASLITNAATLSHVCYGYAPVAMGPGQSFLIHQWAASQSTGPTFEIEWAWLEVPQNA